MSRIFKDIGEPIQLYTEVLNIGKTVSCKNIYINLYKSIMNHSFYYNIINIASKKKIRWVVGFTKMPGEVEIVLVHSISSGKKVYHIL